MNTPPGWGSVGAPKFQAVVTGRRAVVPLTIGVPGACPSLGSRHSFSFPSTKQVSVELHPAGGELLPHTQGGRAGWDTLRAWPEGRVHRRPLPGEHTLPGV